MNKPLKKKKSGTVACACNPTTEEIKTDRFQTSEETVSRSKVDGAQGTTIRVVLQIHVHTHVPACAHIHTKQNT